MTNAQLLENLTYNGWSNYETWNVALWIQNDDGLYNLACECGSYEDTVEALTEMRIFKTPDGVRYDDPKINRAEMNADVYDF